MVEAGKYIFAFLMILAGLMHFLKPKFYLKIMPPYLPAPYSLVLISGIVEILCGILLLWPTTQTLGAYLTIVLLIAVFPANIEMTRQYYVRKKKGFWLTVLRLPLQILLIWWAFQFIK
ncbi:DoxX family protein [Kaistella palustris]|uniref:DoxX family protein n=1 Tax=Kaistella palustris TaxID=493376 RepID=UPI0004104DF8|nr:DoxX family protein [Kaistella palustris]